MKTENRNNWKLLFTPDVDPYMNMAIDEALTRKCMDSENGQATIRFYTWKNTSCSIGYFQKAETVLKILKDKGFTFVRRPTGGGIVYHGNDITFSIIKKRTRDSKPEDITSFYKLIGKSILKGLDSLGLSSTFYNPEETSHHSESEGKHLNNDLSQQLVCSVTPAKYDILINGIKVAGYAARKSQSTILCQGYLDVYDNWRGKYKDSRTETINLLFKNLSSSFEKVFNTTLTFTQLTEEEEKSAQKIRDNKYACKEWNYRK